MLFIFIFVVLHCMSCYIVLCCIYSGLRDADDYVYCSNLGTWYSRNGKMKSKKEEEKRKKEKKICCVCCMSVFRGLTV